MKKVNVILSLLIFMIMNVQVSYGQICNTSGNLVIYSNYDGGIITINVDANIPNLKIGICTYEAAEIHITGTFSSNVTGVIYAGYDGGNDNCSLGVTTTTIIGVSASIATINVYPSVGYTPYHGFGNPNMDGCYQCDTTVSSGGVNSPDEVVYYFKQATGGVFRSHDTQYNCWNNATYNVSAGGNCCIVNPNSACVAPSIPVSTTSSVNLTFCAGLTSTLSATSSGTVNWYASNTSTSVLSSGNSFITPTLSAGTYTYYAGASNTCSNSASRTPITFTVKALPNVSVVPSSSFVCLGQTATLTASGASTYSWNTTSTNTTIIVSPSSNTSYTVTGVANNGCKNSASVNMVVSACTGIDQAANNGNETILIYPNPSNGRLSIDTYNDETKRIELMDVNGKLIYSATSSESVINLELVDLQKGLYFVRVIGKTQLRNTKLIIE